MSQHILVTGAAGFIGSNLVRDLISRGYKVTGIDKRSVPEGRELPAEASFEQVNIEDMENLTRVTSGVHYILHAAALPRVQFSLENPRQTHESNVNGTFNVLEAARANGVKRVIFSSSSSVYGDQDTLPFTEDMRPNPKSPYALHKLTGEYHCSVWSEVFGVPTVSLRYFNVYGPGQAAEGAYALVIAKFLKMRDEEKPLTITGDGEQTRDFTHVDDVVDANLKAMTSGKVGAGEAINIGAGDNKSVNQIAEMIGGPTEHIEARFEPKHTYADNTKAKELLGWEPTKKIEDAIEELREHEGRYVLPGWE